MSFYAVRAGRKTGIFNTWTECEEQVKGFSGAAYKKFKTLTEAESFLTTKKQQTTAVSKISTSLTKSKRKRSPSVDRETQEQKEIEELLREALENEDMLPPAVEKRSKHDLSETTLKKYGGHFFHEDKEGFVHVYTDGACGNNGKANATAGLGVYFGDNHPLNISESITGDKVTNNIGEIRAAIRAIQTAQKYKVLRLNVFTDSQFLINSVCKWMSNWKDNGWKLASGKAVVNQEDFKILDNLIESGNMLIKWTYVAGHKGHHGNEQADRLAREGALRTKSSRN